MEKVRLSVDYSRTDKCFFHLLAVKYCGATAASEKAIVWEC